MNINLTTPITLAHDFTLMSTPLLLLLLFFLISPLLLIYNKSFKRRSPPLLPPGPCGFPIVGNMFRMGKLVHVSLAKLAQIYGPLMSLRLGGRLYVVVSSPSAAAQVLRTHDHMLSGRLISNTLKTKDSKLHNLSLVFSDECDDNWKSLRTIYRDELFSAKAVESRVEVREAKVAELLNHLASSKVQGQVVKMRDVLFVTTLNILSNTLFSRDLIDFEGKGVGQVLREYTRKFAEWGATQDFFDMNPVLSAWKQRSMLEKFEKIYEEMCSAWVDIVRERRTTKQIGGAHDDHCMKRDFIDALIGKGFTDEQMNPLIQELFNAGTNSQIATIEWTLVELIRNEESMQKVRNEIARAVDVGDRLRESHIPLLPFLEACVKETLRLHPAGPLLIPHCALQTCSVMGYTVPKDSIVLVNMWAIGRDPKIWDDPLSFKPERFLVSGCRLDYKGQDLQFIPFGSGRRMCPGYPFALASVRLILAALVHAFDLFLSPNTDPSSVNMDEVFDITMQMREPLCVVPRLRKEMKQLDIEDADD